MTQQASPDPITLEPTASQDADLAMVETDTATVVESYANSLMDELFDDVDNILAGEYDRKTAVECSAAAAQELNTPQEETASGALAPVSSALDRSQPLALSAESSPAPNQTSVRKGLLGLAFDRLLVGAAGVSLLLTGVFWFAQHQRTPEFMLTAIPEAAITPEALKAEADAQFLKYLERSLDVIDDQIRVERGVTAISRESSSPSVTGSPRIAISNVLSPPGGGSGSASLLAGNRPSSNRPNVIERVYIPVYQPPSSQTLPALSNPSANPSISVVPGSIPNIAPISAHVLVGILELGDRSAALFEINGQAQRFYIGENIGSSGWKLVSVANQEAVIRRNGEVRSVYVGQQF
ncbi:MAG: hypothetical protein QNJ46_04785 [Leptolyngbyaceae cyanobacterium MO_188.B28]|nr:hypothetical protein [Leptolyngbyaceae cyanobacterium MO_188.B28]